MWPSSDRGLVVSAGGETNLVRLPSPDGRRTAVVVELDGGATTGYGYSVRVDGVEAAMAYKAERADGTDGIDVRWLDARTLEVTFAHARFTRTKSLPGLKVVLHDSVDPPEPSDQEPP